MSPLGHHLRMHALDNRALVRSALERRTLAKVVLGLGRDYGLLAFCAPDTHLHLEVLCGREAAGRLGQRVGSSLKQRLGVPVALESYRPEPIRTQAHLKNTLRYILTQHDHHGLSLGITIESTNLPDLLGGGLLGRYTRDALRRCLPRVTGGILMSWVGVDRLSPADGPLEALAEGTCAATGLPDLRGRAAATLDARRALLEVLGERLRPEAAARLLGIGRRTLFTLRKRSVSPNLVSAVRWQLGLRQCLARGHECRIEGTC